MVKVLEYSNYLVCVRLYILVTKCQLPIPKIKYFSNQKELDLSIAGVGSTGKTMNLYTAIFDRNQSHFLQI